MLSAAWLHPPVATPTGKPSAPAPNGPQWLKSLVSSPRSRRLSADPLLSATAKAQMARTGSRAVQRSRGAHMKPCAQAALALALVGGTVLATGDTIATTRALRHRGHGSRHGSSRAGFVLAAPGSGASSARPRAQGRNRGSWVAERSRRSRGSSQDQGRDWRRQPREGRGGRAREAFAWEREPVRHGRGSISAAAEDNGDACGDVPPRAPGHTARADSEGGDAAAAAAAAPTPTAAATQTHETAQERWIRRMDTAVRSRPHSPDETLSPEGGQELGPGPPEGLRRANRGLRGKRPFRDARASSPLARGFLSQCH